MPAAMPEARIPGTAVIPPSSHWISGVWILGGMRILGIDRRGLEPRPLIPAHHDVEVLHAVSRAALAKVVEGGDANRAARARVGHDGDITEIGAGHRACRRPLAFGHHAHEGLARV